jgi:hypothetical protein
MFAKLFDGSLLALGALLVAAAPAPEVKDCCAQKLACCSPPSACCFADVKTGCCAQGKRCCAEKRACCNAPQKCCAEGAACCDAGKACCGDKAAGATSAVSVPACCAAKGKPAS